MSKIIKKKAVSKKKAAVKKTKILDTLNVVSNHPVADNNPGGPLTQGISAYRAAIHPGNGYGEIEIKDGTGVITKIFAATNPALYAAVLLTLTNPTKSITQGGYLYVTG